MKTARGTLGLNGVVLMSLALACEGGNSPSAPALSESAGFSASTQVLGSGAGQPGTPVPVTGTFSLTFEPVAVRQAGGNTFIDYTFHEQSLGSFSGTRVGTGTLVIHADGTINFKDSGPFTGTVIGIPGSVKVDVRGQGTFASFDGSFTVYANSGTEGLTGLQGVAKITGAATGPASVAGRYDGQVHF